MKEGDPMSKRKQFWFLCGVLAVLLFLTACESSDEVKDGEPFLYYLNGEMTGLVKSAYEIGEGSAEEKAEKMLTALQKQPDDIERYSVFPENVTVQKITLDRQNLQIDLSSDYEKAEVTKQVLFQSAVVQSLVQIDGIDTVEFLIDGEPLRNTDGTLVGRLGADNFVQNVGSALHSYQTAELTLYFTDEEGSELVKETREIRYNSNVSKEKLIVEQVIKGDSSSGINPTVNPATRVLGVTSEEGICYVNLDEAFLENIYGVKPEVVVYSLVNSIIDGSEVDQVQISVNGESQIMYMDTVDLSKPLSKKD